MLGYVILRPLMTAVGVVAQLIGVYGDGQLRFDRVYLYTTVVSNVSQVRVCVCGSAPRAGCALRLSVPCSVHKSMRHLMLC